MLEKDSEWILPENLKKQELRARKLVNEGGADYGGDFGAYYAYRKGINFDFIKSHAFSTDKKALSYAKNLRAFLHSCNIKLAGEILDVGCAIGTITHSIDILKNENVGNTYGIDISEDGIEVARKKYPKCKFFKQSADDLSNFDDDLFDIIHCREFYPFTRTNDKKYQINYLTMFYKKLRSHGCVILEMSTLNRGFGNNFRETRSELKNIGYSVINRNLVVPAIIVNLFGVISYKSYFYKLLKYFIQLLYNKRARYFYILVK